MRDIISELPDFLENIPDPLADVSAQQSVSSNAWDMLNEVEKYNNVEDYGNGPLLVGPFEAGWNKSQELMWTGLDSVAEAAGVSTPEWLEEAILENKEIADAANIDSFFDELVFAGGQVGPAAIGGLAGSVLAPLIGTTAGVGSLAVGGLAAVGMTLGDLQMKAKDLDPQHEADLRQIATGTVMAAPDAFLLGRLSKAASPIKDLMTDAVVNKLKSNMAGTATKIATTAAGVGVAEGSQDIGTSLAANWLTDTAIDESRIQTIVKQGMHEALIGGILGVPVGGLSAYTDNVIQKQAEFEAGKAEELLAEQEAIREYKELYGDVHPFAPTDYEGNYNDPLEAGPLDRDEEGNINEPVQQPMPNAASDPGFFTMAFNTLTGNITDAVKGRNRSNPYVQQILNPIAMRKTERSTGQYTINEKSSIDTGEVAFDIGKDFFNASKADARAAVDRRISGEPDLDNPIDFALNEMLNGDVMRQKVFDASRGKIDPYEADTLWTDPTYMPLASTLEWDQIASDPDAITKLETMMREQGIEEGKIAHMRNVVKNKIRDFEKHGTDLHTGNVADTKWELGYIESLEEALEEGSTDKRVKGLINKISNKKESYQRQSPLTLERELRYAPEAWLDQYKNDKLDPRQVMYHHVLKNMEHAAVMDAYGYDLTNFHEGVARAIVWGKENDAPLSQKDITGMYDALRTVQRIHLRPVSPSFRMNQQRAKAFLNTTLLGLSALVSIPEALTIGLNTSMRSSIAGLAETIRFRDNRKWSELNPTERAKVLTAADDLGVSASQATEFVANRTNQSTADMGPVEQAFIRYVTGLPYVQQFLTVWGTKAIDHHNRRLISALESGDGASRNRAILELGNKGIDVEQAQQWHKQGYDPSNEWYHQEYLPSLLSDVRDTIVDPDPTDKPAWQNDERLMLVSHLKGFMTAFTNRVMRGTKDRWATEGPARNRDLLARVAPYTAMYLLAQVGISMLRDVLKSGEVDDEKTFESRVWNAFGYLGASAYFVDMSNAFMWRSSPLGSALGPAASISLQLTGATVESISEMDPDRVLDVTIQRAVPNLVGKDAVLDVIKDAWGLE